MLWTVSQAKPSGRATLESIALGGVVKCPKGGGEKWGTYTTPTQNLQSLTRAAQAGISGPTPAQFCDH